MLLGCDLPFVKERSTPILHEKESKFIGVVTDKEARNRRGGRVGCRSAS